MLFFVIVNPPASKPLSPPRPPRQNMNLRQNDTEVYKLKTNAWSCRLSNETQLSVEALSPGQKTASHTEEIKQSLQMVKYSHVTGREGNVDDTHI